MRFRSHVTDGFQVSAVTGTHTASFGISATADLTGLLGFSVQQIKSGGAPHWVKGFKVFESLVPAPKPSDEVSTELHPIQSFVWDVFTLDPATSYEFRFYPFRGTPKARILGTPIAIAIQTEPQSVATAEHDVFFNRGVASSQAYAREFDNKRPDDQGSSAKNKKAFDWLSRGLDAAILAFIDASKHGDTLHGCFYEFTYVPVVHAFARAVKRGVDVKLVIDGKQNGSSTEKPSPRSANLDAITEAELPTDNVILREARKNDLQHNKFMVLHRHGAPAEVWTGSTNISLNGIFGQTNVGHWIRNPDVAKQYEAYWQLVAADPGAKDGTSTQARHAANLAYYKSVDALASVPVATTDIPKGVTAVFSPRSKDDALALYAKCISDSQRLGCITLAFGVTQQIKDELEKNTSASAPSFLLLEKKDEKDPKSNKAFVSLNARNNVYEAWGSFIDDPVYQWTRETNLFKLNVATNVGYIHTKFLLADPLGDDPIVISGSANFSEASTKEGNDENMLWIRGDLRTADIYFTEFNRLFSHYYFRSIVESKGGTNSNGSSWFLDETDGWAADYRPNTLKVKRVDEFRNMFIPDP